MVDFGPETKYNTRNLIKPRTNPWRTYKRILGYALQYKGRLFISIVFAIFVAASFSSMILSVGSAVKLLFTDDASFQEAKTHLVAQVDKFSTRVERITGRSPEGLSEWVDRTLDNMKRNRTRTIHILSITLVSLALLGGLSRFIQEYLAGSIGASISVQLGREMFENVVHLPLSFFEKRTTGEILARLTNDVFMVNRGLANTFVKLFREPITIVFYLALALATDWKLTLTVLIVLPIVGYVIATVGRKVRKAVRRSLENVSSTASVGAETVNGIMVVKAFCMEDYEVSRVRVELDKLRRHLTKMVRADAAIEPITSFILVIGLVIFMLLANQAVESSASQNMTPTPTTVSVQMMNQPTEEASQGTAKHGAGKSEKKRGLDAGDLVILLGALVAMMDPLRKLSSVNNLIQTSVASAERVFEFIDEKSSIVEAPDAIEIAPMKESLRFENVRFSYDGKTEVLKGLDFEIKKGEMVAMVGFSGAGKSTIVKLIPRFYDVTAGRIAIDGVDIRRATFKSLRDQISIVTQNTILFNESIRDNIAFGRQAFSDERVRQAAAAANAAEFIEKLPAQYQTKIGEAGGTLSGGQRQRLAVARAIIKDPAILILDEATSSLDTESEQAIQKAIEELVVGRTTIVIAHRLSTVQRADRILVIEDGQIAEQGSHAELLAKQGLYRRLYDVQFAPVAEKKTE